MYKTENGFQPQKIVTSLVTETKKNVRYEETLINQRFVKGMRKDAVRR